MSSASKRVTPLVASAAADGARLIVLTEMFAGSVATANSTTRVGRR